ncbi:hypothetical protein LJR129_003265 [Acidovorax sp. LjRoot129]|uniref:hypothetical protein n=1 Tax=Acidovorax sp. LjRoot129 TaxID=3342260 RepID=UPI003ECE1838
MTHQTSNQRKKNHSHLECNFTYLQATAKHPCFAQPAFAFHPAVVKAVWLEPVGLPQMPP